MSRCQRCFKPTQITTCSWFNTQTICSACSDEESRHPDIDYAKRVESEACRRGDYNFPGVGWPGKDGRVQR
jgi:hypothetical protein